MNYNRNRKIMQVKESTLVVGVDIAKKKFIIALCCKLIRILFTLWKKQVKYDSQKLLRDIERSNLQGFA